MLSLVLIGLIGGLITGISPCILPVLPVVFFAGGAGKQRTTAGGAGARTAGEQATGARAVTAGAGSAVAGSDGTGSGGGVAVSAPAEAESAPKERRSLRPYAIIAGLVLSFSVFTLLGSLLISVLGLPDNILRVVGLTLLVLIGLGLLFPKLEALLERPFARLPQRQVGADAGPFVLGLGLGLLYVPCAGPVLTAITVAGARHDISWNTVALTLSFAVGATLPLLVFALAGQRVAQRVAAFRNHAATVRKVGGVVMLALAVALAFNLTDALQRALPGYTDTLQQKVEGSPALGGGPHLSNLTNDTNSGLSQCTPGATELQSCGPAPAFSEIQQWLNTPGGAPVDLASLRGKVVLVDFWAYSCINCQRAQPHVTAWANAYAGSGLQVIGVHTPEFPFERDPVNVAAAARQFGITYPVALDNRLATFTDYRNQYWPAEYLIDATGTVRHIAFGEGHYDRTEGLIRELLGQTRPGVALPAATEVADTTPVSATLTPETYLAYGRTRSYVGRPLVHNAPAEYQFPLGLPPNGIGLDGTWTTNDSYFQAGPDARMRLSYNARDVFLVLAGQGTATVSQPGRPDLTIPVSGTPNSYRLLTGDAQRTGELTVTLSPGLQAFDFTFG